MKGLSRRDFLKSLGAAGAGLWLLQDPTGATWAAPSGSGELKIKYARETTSICPYCGVGCGVIVYAENDKVTYIEGDPDHPINEGALCPKGMSISDLSYIVDDRGQRVPNPGRLRKVLYRAPRSDRWEEKSWDWALKEIALRVKKTRDASFEKVDAKGVTVNRTPAIALLGSAALDNEENYALQKLVRALGMVNIDHHARL